jgi:hypothetical protein
LTNIPVDNETVVIEKGTDVIPAPTTQLIIERAVFKID